MVEFKLAMLEVRFRLPLIAPMKIEGYIIKCKNCGWETAKRLPNKGKNQCLGCLKKCFSYTKATFDIEH